jgi:hypothetical protein
MIGDSIYPGFHFVILDAKQHTANPRCSSTVSKSVAGDHHLSYSSCKSAGNPGTNRTTQAEISNLLRLSYPGRVTALGLETTGGQQQPGEQFYKRRPERVWTLNDLDYEETLRNFQHLFNNNPEVRKLVKDWERTILLSATDTGSKYSLLVKGEKLAEVRTTLPMDEDDGDGLVYLQAEESVLRQIFSGKYNPATALLDGALAIFSEERDKVKLEALALAIWHLG